MGRAQRNSLRCVRQRAREGSCETSGGAEPVADREPRLPWGRRRWENAMATAATVRLARRSGLDRARGARARPERGDAG